MTVVGICGLGSIGSRHARVFADLPGVQVVGYDPGGVGATGLPGGCRVATTFSALLDRGIDGLVVAAPDAAHATAAHEACERGIPVLLEKPIADTPAAGRCVVASAQSTGTPVLVGYVLRHVRCMQLAQQLIGQGRIGRALSFQVMLGAYETLRVARSRFDEPAYGALFRDYSHEWDYLRWLIAPVRGGFALARRAGARTQQQDPNVVDAVLRLADGTTGTVHLDYVQDPGTRRFTIVGDEATLEVDVPAGLIRLLRAGENEQTMRVAEHRDAGFRRQAEHFLAVATAGVSPAVDVHDGFAALAVADALRRSALDGRWTDVEDD